jgi:hypothetical protein
MRTRQGIKNIYHIGEHAENKTGLAATWQENVKIEFYDVIKKLQLACCLESGNARLKRLQYGRSRKRLSGSPASWQLHCNIDDMILIR